MPAIDQCRLALANVLEPPPRLSVSEWADAYRRLTSEASAESGAWETSRAPYQKEWMDVLGPHSRFERVVLMTSAQVGKTETLNNFIGYVIDRDPGPVMVVQPTLEIAEAFSKDRLAPMVTASPCLRGKVSDVRARDSGNTTLHKRFAGGHVTMAGANSPAGLSARPIRYLCLDEIDRFPPSAGSEGDPVSLATKRTAVFWNRKILMCSTPTSKGSSRIEQAFLESDQRRYWVPCPLCGDYQVLMFGRLEWPEGKPQDAEYRCEHCEKMIPHFRKAWMLTQGEWRPDNPASRIAGFRISQLYSFAVAWGETAEEFIAAKGSPETLRTFINTALGELWDDEGATTTNESSLLARREIYPADVPAGACVLTAGIDCQDDRLEVELVGWGANGEESWSIDYRVFPGDPSGPRVWSDLDQYLLQSWQHENGARLPIAAACVDSGGHHTNSVYRFCADRYGRKVFAIKGIAGSNPVWPKRPTRNTIARHPVWLVGVDSAKATIAARLRIETPGDPGYCHFPVSRDAEYFSQLLSEFLKTEYRRGVPVRTWIRKKGRRAEAWDNRVYAFCALEGLKAMGLRLDRQAQLLAKASVAPKGPPPGEVAAAQASQKFRIRLGGF
jgi:phage terminase large subunit GpA-like protein